MMSFLKKIQIKDSSIVLNDILLLVKPHPFIAVSEK